MSLQWMGEVTTTRMKATGQSKQGWYSCSLRGYTEWEHPPIKEEVATTNCRPKYANIDMEMLESRLRDMFSASDEEGKGYLSRQQATAVVNNVAAETHFTDPIHGLWHIVLSI